MFELAEHRSAFIQRGLLKIFPVNYDVFDSEKVKKIKNKI